MNKITFMKTVASGNDFVIVEKLQRGSYNLPRLAREICNRKFGIGADGLLLLEKSKKADIRMRIFNADGSEAQMCGNGARCAALYINKRNVKIVTSAGIIESVINGNNVRIKLTEPKNLKVDIPINVNGRTLHVNFIDTGVPHTVIFVKGIDEIDVFGIGKKIRYHKKFKPCGTNVDFVEILNNNSIKVRTYERGVEDETLACGTGAVAAALVANSKWSRMQLSKEVTLRDTEVKQKQLPHSGQITSYEKINVHTRSGELLKVYFEKIHNRFTNVWLEGKVRIVCKGEYYV